MNRIKTLVFSLATLSMVFCMAFVGFAADKAIKSVTIKVSYTEYEQENPDDESGVNIQASGTGYSLGQYEITNQEQVWNNGANPEMNIYVEASEGYYFNITKASQIKLQGCTYKSAKRQNSSTVLVVGVTVDQVKRSVAEVEDIKLSQDGKVTWQPLGNVSSYEVRAFRDGRYLAAAPITGTEFNISSYFTKGGSYMVKVRGVHKMDANVKGEWAESEEIYISDEQAKANLEAAEAAESAGDWIQDAKGWRFRLPDGTFVTCAWRKINKEWYYFGTDSYMQVGWVQYDGSWYFMDPVLGSMWYNKTTPDGYSIGIDGRVSK